MTIGKRVFGLVAATVPLLVATTSFGEVFRAPGFDDLPEVPATVAPTAPPDSVPSGTTTGDLSLFPQPAQTYPMPQRGRGKPKMYTQPGMIEVRPKFEGACVSLAEQGGGAFRQSQMYVTAVQPPTVVRIEALKEDKGVATYEVSEVVVDGKTLGTKEISHSSVPLKKVGVGQDGIAAWGFRSGTSLHVLVPQTQQGNLVDDEGRFVQVSCGALHAELEVEKGVSRSISGFVMRNVMIEDTRTNDQKQPPRQQSRRMAFSTSVSQTSADKSPLVSVTMRWLDELQPNERVQDPNTPPTPLAAHFTASSSISK